MRICRYNWIVIVAIVVHGLWGILLLFTPEPLGCTPMAETPFRRHQHLAASIYLLAAILAVLPLLWSKLESSWYGLLLCLPQQFLLMMSAFTAILCVVRGTYADGVPRPWAFIFADQAWGIFGMLFHTVALVDWYYFSRLGIVSGPDNE